jgi:hypothetical protein
LSVPRQPVIGPLARTTLDGQTDCFKIDRICLSVVNPSSVRWLGSTLDGQTDCFKIDRICLSVVNPSSVRWLGTTLYGQTDCFKIDRICLSVVNPSSVRWLGTTLDGQTDCFKIDRICLSLVNPSSVRWLGTTSWYDARKYDIANRLQHFCTVISEYGEGYGGTRALAYRLTLPFRRENEKDGECNFLPTDT